MGGGGRGDESDRTSRAVGEATLFKLARTAFVHAAGGGLHDVHIVRPRLVLPPTTTALRHAPSFVPARALLQNEGAGSIASIWLAGSVGVSLW